MLNPHKEIEVEIGCADAQFLFQRAKTDPSRQYFGLEIRDYLVQAVNKKAQTSQLPVCGIFCHANEHVKNLFASRSIDRIYLNFPDPWFKERHKKRRMIDKELLLQCARMLKPGGQLFFQSDIWDVAIEVLDLVEGLNEYFVNSAGAWSFLKGPHPFEAVSWREQHCKEIQKKVWRILCERNLETTL